MKLSRITGTIGFKLSVLYLALFVLTFLAIGLTVYILTTRILEQQIKDNIDIEAEEMNKVYNDGGLPALKNEIDYKEEFVTSGQTYKYNLIDSDGELIIGNIRGLNLTEGWQIIPFIPGRKKRNNDYDDFLKIKVFRLGDRYWMGIGYNYDYIEDAGDAVIKAFSWGLLILLVLGSISGFYLSNSFLKKLESITNLTQAIIAGDIRHRLRISESNDELDNLAALLNQMLDKICKLIENVQQVSNDIAHDMRTPISHLKFSLENMLNENMTVDQYKILLSGMIDKIDSILNTFSALLRIAQIESGSRRSGFSMVNLSEVIQTVSDALDPVAEEQSKRIICNIDREIFISGDRELLTQMAFNLVENAIVHTITPAEINVGLHKNSTTIRFQVSDNGQGIPEYLSEKVFQRFYKVDKERNSSGSGLGLSIVSAIAELHGANIQLSDNKPGLRVIIEFEAIRSDWQVPAHIHS